MKAHHVKASSMIHSSYKGSGQFVAYCRAYGKNFILMGEDIQSCHPTHKMKRLFKEFVKCADKDTRAARIEEKFLNKFDGDFTVMKLKSKDKVNLPEKHSIRGEKGKFASFIDGNKYKYVIMAEFTSHHPTHKLANMFGDFKNYIQFNSSAESIQRNISNDFNADVKVMKFKLKH